MTFSEELEGERLVPGETSAESWAEHLERYRFAAKFVRNRAVVDLACGFGFGSDVLQRAGAKSVVGVDVDREAVSYATEHYRDPPLRFALADGQALPFHSASFDACASMGTLAHVRRPQAFLSDIWRVLRPGGLLVLSTPNRLVSNPGRSRGARPINPYHVMEPTFTEMRRLLGSSFRVKGYYGQMFQPVETILTPGSLLTILARHPALPLLILPRAGEFARVASGRSSKRRDLRVYRYAVLPFEGRLMAEAEPRQMVLVCVRNAVRADGSPDASAV